MKLESAIKTAQWRLFAAVDLAAFIFRYVNGLCMHLIADFMSHIQITGLICNCSGNRYWSSWSICPLAKTGVNGDKLPVLVLSPLEVKSVNPTTNSGRSCIMCPICTDKILCFFTADGVIVSKFDSCPPCYILINTYIGFEPLGAPLNHCNFDSHSPVCILINVSTVSQCLCAPSTQFLIVRDNIFHVCHL